MLCVYFEHSYVLSFMSSHSAETEQSHSRVTLQWPFHTAIFQPDCSTDLNQDSMPETRMASAKKGDANFEKFVRDTLGLLTVEIDSLIESHKTLNDKLSVLEEHLKKNTVK